MRIGVWITKSALSTPDQVAEHLARLGVDTGNIMLNDYAGARAERPFVTHDINKIVALATELRRVGIKVELTTWVMRHKKFIEGMGEQLPTLMRATQAERLWLDAEEPWTQSQAALSDEAATALIDDVLPGTELGLSAISAARETLLDSLASLCGWWSPQAYATTKPSSMNPNSAVQSSLQRWRSRFGEPRRGWMMGLACYSQPVPASSSMQPCLDSTRSAGIEECCYWSHRSMMLREDVMAVVKGADDPETLPRDQSGSLMPWVDIEELPSGVRDIVVGQVQGLLEAHAKMDDDLLSPGAIDLLPGPRTQMSLERFQVSRGLEPGPCDGATWWHLLRAA